MVELPVKRKIVKGGILDVKSLGVQGMCEYGTNRFGWVFYRWPGEADDKWRSCAP